MIGFVRMMVMNMADIDADILVGKFTFPTRIGLKNSQIIHNIGMIAAYCLLLLEFSYFNLSIV
jgi:1,4-dihydroxy-2-naphthoate octaprenyltransferase